MTSKSMFDKEVIEDLKSRMFEILQGSGQFKNVTREGDRIEIHLDKENEFVFVETMSTYPTGSSVFSRASGLRIKFGSSLSWRHKIKSYMVPSFERGSNEWVFSRSKLLKKTSDAVSLVKQWVASDNKKQRGEEQFRELVERELASLGKASSLRPKYGSDKRLAIALPWSHVILSTWDEGGTFTFESIQPRKGEGVTTPKYSLEMVKEVLTKLEKVFAEEQDDRAN